jgi:FkbM family methyltransferase
VGIKHELRRQLWRLGFDVSRFDPHSHPVARRRFLLAASAIGVVLDVGASTGEWAQVLRQEIGYAGLIYSFEPTSAAFRELNARASTDDKWTALNYALGEDDGQRTINVAANLDSSSLLEMLPRHEAAAPGSAFVSSETVEVRALDGIFDELCPAGESAFLKVDTQGYESHVLAGAGRSLPRIDLVQLEMSLVPLYDGAATHIHLLEIMSEQGYELVDLDRGFTHPRTGQLLQVDGIFRRPTPAARPQEGSNPGR